MTAETAPPLSFDEAPVFVPGFEATSFSFAFEIGGPKESADIFEAGKDRCAFLLRDIVESIEEEDPAAYRQLIEPVRSFLDDVTTGPPGTNGRPLIITASGAPTDDASRRVALVRPQSWHYEFEGDTTTLHPGEGRQSFDLWLRDSFSIFESGRIFFVLTLTTAADVLLDEYDVIHLQQLAIDAERRDQGDFLGFAWAEADSILAKRGSPARLPESLSLIELANARLAQLLAAADAERDPSGQGRESPPASAYPNGVVCVLRRFELIPSDRVAVGVEDFRNLCISIEDEKLLGTAKSTFDSIPTQSASDKAILADAWAARQAERSNADRLHHRAEDETFDRALLAFAGLTQGVPDFPNQDASEVYDSTRPTARSVESALYSHPRFIMEIAENWRSFKRARPTLGTCPYLLLMFLVATHDELIVAEMEVRLEQLLFGGGRKGARAGIKVAVQPLAAVRGLLAKAQGLGGGSVGTLHSNLEHRLELFRWGSIHRSGNVFRYPKEKAALHAIHDAMAIPQRFGDVHSLIDRLESLVEDVSSLKSLYAQSRTNIILFLLALLGIVSATRELAEMSGQPLLQVAAILAVPLAIAVISRAGFGTGLKAMLYSLVMAASFYLLWPMLVAG